MSKHKRARPPRPKVKILGRETHDPRNPKARDCGTCGSCEKLGLPFDAPGIGGCLWARGLWGKDLASRPDRTGCVPWVMNDPCPPGALLLFVRTDKPTAWRRGVAARIIKGAMRQGRTVFLDTGAERRFYVTA